MQTRGGGKKIGRLCGHHKWRAPNLDSSAKFNNMSLFASSQKSKDILNGNISNSPVCLCIRACVCPILGYASSLVW